MDNSEKTIEHILPGNRVIVISNFEKLFELFYLYDTDEIIKSIKNGSLQSSSGLFSSSSGNDTQNLNELLIQSISELSVTPMILLEPQD